MKRTMITNAIIIAVLVILSLFASSASAVTTFSYTLQPLYRGNTQVNNVSLMVNVYWGNEYIPPLLAILKKYNIHTTFFVGGSWVNKNNELFMDIVAGGHEIGNHGFFHKDGDKLNVEQNMQEITANHKLVYALSGVEMNLFAPPSGAYNTSTMQACENLGYKAIMWTYDTIDWRDQDADIICTRATKNMQNGNLILMHPTASTVIALPKIIEKYMDSGFNLTTVSNAIK